MLLLYRLCAVEAALTRVHLCLVFVVLASSCGLRKGPRIDPLTAALNRVDRAWAARSTDGFEPVRTAIESARRVGGKTHPEVLWRESRLEAGRGVAASSDTVALEHYGAARDAALSCMLADPEFAYAFRNEGMGPALAKLSLARSVCAPWAAWSWSRSMVTLGGRAAAIDRPRVEALVSSPRTQELAPELTAHASLLLRTSIVRDSRELRALVSEYERAIRQRPQDLVLRSDFVMYVAIPLGGRDLIVSQADAVERSTSNTPEERASRQRVIHAQP